MLELRVERGFDRALDLGEGRGRQIVLQLRQVRRGLFADEVGPRRERLAELHRGRTDRDQRVCIVRSFRNPRAEARDSRQPSHGRRRQRIFLDAAQRAVLGESPAPHQQTPQVRDAGGQIFHPEWMVTRPPSIGSAAARAKPASAIIALNLAGRGKRRMLSTR